MDAGPQETVVSDTSVIRSDGRRWGGSLPVIGAVEEVPGSWGLTVLQWRG